MKRIKILFTIPNFDTAGSGRVLYDLAKGLNKDIFEIEIACARRGGHFFKTVESLGYPIHIFETKTFYKPYATLPFRIWKISKFFRKHRFDIVHSWQWSSDWTEALAARLAGSKWLYTKKAMGFSSRHWKIKSYLAHFIVTINEEMKDYFPNKKNQKLIPLGIDTNYYNPIHFNEKSVNNNSCFHLVMVANLVPVKGVDVLLQAIKLLKNSNLKVSIVGKKDNAYGKEMQLLAENLNLGNQVFFLGKKKDVRKFIADADLYVIPTLNESRKEGMPMALVEAMSMAIPVLGADISGINFVLKSFPSLLFEAGNAQALANKISDIHALAVQDRIALGKNLRAYVQNHFTLKKFTEAHETIYLNLME